MQDTRKSSINEKFSWYDIKNSIKTKLSRSWKYFTSVVNVWALKRIQWKKTRKDCLKLRRIRKIWKLSIYKNREEKEKYQWVWWDR